MRYKKNWDPNQYYKDTSIAEEYDDQRFASLPGKVFNALEKRSIRRAFAGFPTDALVLDAPCGTGRLAEVLLEQGFRVYGQDISDEMLTVARRRLARFGDRFQTGVGDIRELESSGRTFDGALCARFLMHFPLADQIEFLKAIGTITKERIVFNQSVNTLYHRMRRGLKRVLRNQDPVGFPMTPGEIDTLVQQANLKLIKKFQTAPLVSEASVFVCTRQES